MIAVGSRSRWPRLWLAVTIAFLGSCGRGSAQTFGLFKDNVINVGGVERTYDLYVPEQAHAEASAPLVVLLHANRSSTDDLTGESRAASPYAVWQEVADDNGLLLLVPQGADGPSGHAGWNDCRADGQGNPTTDDVAFIDAAITQVGSSYQVDKGRVFATGTSNGGHMAIRLAQESASSVAGIAVIAAGMPATSQCASSAGPISALFMVGTADPIAPFDGGAMASDRGTILSAADSVNYWLGRNGMTDPPVVNDFEDIDSEDQSTVQRSLYSSDETGTVVAMYRIDGGGHAEPSIEAHYRPLFERVVGNQNHDIEMATEVWSFFSSIPTEGS